MPLDRASALGYTTPARSSARSRASRSPRTSRCFRTRSSAWRRRPLRRAARSRTSSRTGKRALRDHRLRGAERRRPGAARVTTSTSSSIYDVEFPAVPGRPPDGRNYLVQTILQNVEGPGGLSDRRRRGAGGDAQRRRSARPQHAKPRPTPGAATVTLALSPEEAQKIYLAEGNGKLRSRCALTAMASRSPSTS